MFKSSLWWSKYSIRLFNNGNSIKYWKTIRTTRKIKKSKKWKKKWWKKNENNPLEDFLNQNKNNDEIEEDIDLESILNQIPQFEQIRQTIQQRPDLLGPIVEKIAETSPELYQLIQQFPDEFMRIMNDKKPLNQNNNNNNNTNNQNFDEMKKNAPPGTVLITKEEKEAIDRLVDLGFDKMTAAQAYFAFDKNENEAALFLLDQGTDNQFSNLNTSNSNSNNSNTNNNNNNNNNKSNDEKIDEELYDDNKKDEKKDKDDKMDESK